MQTRYSSDNKTWFGIVLATTVVISLSGCGDNGPAIEAHPQTVSFSAAPVPNIDVSTATITATASSGLPVRYSSTTPTICSVNESTGVVTGKASGICTITANQSGNTIYAPATPATQNVTFRFSQSVTFNAAPVLGIYDRATVSAIASSGLPISYSSTTPAVCSVNSSTGLVTALLTGDCTVAATAGALQATLTISVSAAPGQSTPGAPDNVTATAGNAANTVSVRIGSTTSGGSPITGYTVTSTPAGISATGSASPIIVTCPSSCTGYAFSVVASNALGNSASSVLTDVVTGYNVVETFFEPDTQPKNSIFIGSFTYNSTKGTVSDLLGILSESMTGGLAAYPNDTMTWLQLNNQKSVVPVTLGGVDGLLVTTFLKDSTDTLSNNPAFGGTDGWSPGTGFGLYFGFPGANQGNAYARIFVNTADPTAALTQVQIDKLAYADCTPGGMMGSSCMTGTTVAGYGTIGTMSGYPFSQVITKK